MAACERICRYVRLRVAERREAVLELIKEGMSQRQAAKVLGVGKTTVARDLGPIGPPRPVPARGAGPNGPADRYPELEYYVAAGRTAEAEQLVDALDAATRCAGL